MIRAGSAKKRQTLLSSPIVAVDLRFAQKLRSTGVAWTSSNGQRPAPRSLTFTEAVAKVTEIADASENVCLILEAPLSARFTDTGNPCVREEFERVFDVRKGKNVTRPWYSGPGAATLIAALFFLRRLQEHFVSVDEVPDIWLFEGLHTFKEGPTPHEEDANDLLDAFLKGSVSDVTIDNNSSWLSVLQLLDDGNDTKIPAIVTVKQGTRQCAGVSE